jgi:hypothetical protein
MVKFWRCAAAHALFTRRARVVIFQTLLFVLGVVVILKKQNRTRVAARTACA